MCQTVETNDRTTPDARSPRASKAVIALLAAAVTLIGGCGAPDEEITTPGPTSAAEPSIELPSTTAPPLIGSSVPTSTSTTTSLPERAQEPPPLEARYEVPPTEAEPAAKHLASDIAYSLTTYEADDDHTARLEDLNSLSGLDALAQASGPLIHPGSWSRGEVIYPQLGGLRNGRASVMVVTRQTVGSGSDVEVSVVRTLDIRLVLGEGGWVFDYLSSAGGIFENVEDLATAHAVADDARIEMPDSARLDILAGLVSPTLLDVMADLADRTPYEVVVLATGHPHHVFETDRVSQHTVGQAVDINRIGDRLVVDDRGPDSATRTITEWLYDHPDVRQIGSPWDLDGPGLKRSFTDAVHQDHIHLAVSG